ncbi:MAG: septum formation initiator family protein [Myxococcota bacterium]|nr:septum formation initiator family protein [Myxococcota bacterium]
MLRWLITPALVLCAGLVAWLDPKNGVESWQKHREHLRAARERIAELEAEIEAREKRSKSINEDEFALEAAIREDLGFARPGEIVIRLPRTDLPTANLP